MFSVEDCGLLELEPGWCHDRRRLVEKDPELARERRPELVHDGRDRERKHVDPADDEHVVAPAQDMEPDAGSAAGTR